MEAQQKAPIYYHVTNICVHILSWLGVAMAMMCWVASVPRRSLFLTKTNTGGTYKDKYKENHKDKYKDSWLGVAMAMMGWVASVTRWTSACCYSVNNLGFELFRFVQIHLIKSPCSEHCSRTPQYKGSLAEMEFRIFVFFLKLLYLVRWNIGILKSFKLQR